jgi:hypothetical protein
VFLPVGLLRINEEARPLLIKSLRQQAVSNNQAMATAIAFQKLSRTTTIYEPPLDAVSPADAPSTILVVGWMGGTIKNLSRYTTKYNALYPAARLIVVTSTLTDTPGFKALLSPAELKQRGDTPARALLADTKSTNGRLLIHVFSNGGGMNLANISKTYERMAGRPLPARAVIFDSLPGGDKFTNEFSRWVNAIAIGLPSNPLVRWPGQVLIALMVIVLLGLPSLFGVENAATKARRDLNDKKLINSKAKRLYIYSEADALIGAREVREYAAESAAKGWDVEKIDFGTSGHVRHAIVDPTRYWDAVVRTWKSSA